MRQAILQLRSLMRQAILQLRQLMRQAILQLRQQVRQEGPMLGCKFARRDGSERARAGIWAPPGSAKLCLRRWSLVGVYVV